MRDALKTLEYSDSHHSDCNLRFVPCFWFWLLCVLYLVTKSTVEDSLYCIWEKWSKNTGSLILSFCLKNNSKLKSERCYLEDCSKVRVDIPQSHQPHSVGQKGWLWCSSHDAQVSEVVDHGCVPFKNMNLTLVLIFVEMAHEFLEKL